MNSLSGKKGGDGAGMDKGRSLSEVVAGTPVAKKDGDGGDEGDYEVDDGYVADLTPPSAAAPPAKPPPVVDPSRPSPPPGIAGAPEGEGPLKGRKESDEKKKPEFGPAPPPKPGDPDTSKVDPNRPETHFRDLTERFNALKRNKD